MTKLPVALLLTVAVSLGVTLGVLYLRGVRKPVLVAVHVLVGLGALETLAVTLHQSNVDNSRTISLGMVTASFIAWSLFSGLIRPMLADQWPRQSNGLLITHAAAGLTGFAVFLIWMVRGG